MSVKVAVVTLGCDKNTVDSESMLGFLQTINYLAVTDPLEADVIIINTCGFIESAKEESINTILEAIKLKEFNPELKIIAAGCMVQKYCSELAEEIPELDGFLGSNNVSGLKGLIERVLSGERVTKLTKPLSNPDLYIPRISSTPQYYSYLKIAEGCDNRCSYCAIPDMRGPYTSRSISSLVQEASVLAAGGVKELSLVAQDITLYGRDIYKEGALVELLQELVKLENVDWFRLLYCYPTHITEELIDFIAEEKKICNYLDIPLQHADPQILKRMGRKQNPEEVIALLKKLKRRISELALRTTFIVGFPGETEKHFDNLLSFMEEIQFDWVGIFSYSAEEGTAASQFVPQIPDEIKAERYHRAMLHQRLITSRKNERWLGKVRKVLVERMADERGVGIWQGRTEQQAPEVDGAVYFRGDNLIPGDFVSVKITRVEDYDLLGEIENEFS